jgi:hypothetical protein
MFLVLEASHGRTFETALLLVRTELQRNDNTARNSIHRIVFPDSEHAVESWLSLEGKGVEFLLYDLCGISVTM